MYLDQRLELMLYDRKSGSVGAGNGGGGADDRFGGRDNSWSPLSRPYEYEYGEFKGESGYGNGVRRTRSFGDMSETVG